MYCPSDGDLQVDYGSASINGNGWTINGGGRVSSKTSFNMLGGYVEFDMDVSGAHPGVNQNLYTVSPSGPNCGGDCYCDAQGAGGGCMELDFIETNGNCAGATTWHTSIVGQGGVCGSGGCQHVFGGSNQYHVRTDFSSDGWMVVTVNGEKIDAGALGPRPSGADAGAISSMMRSRGVVLESSQWVGWVPGSCGSGDLGSSVFHISNVRVAGSVVHGVAPSSCGGASVNGMVV